MELHRLVTAVAIVLISERCRTSLCVRQRTARPLSFAGLLLLLLNMSLRLNPLSTAKGKKFTCEMCGKAATLACQHCRVTYYCAQEHQSVDWYGIHEKICQLLGALRTLRPTLGSEDERQRRNLTVQMSQHALIDLRYRQHTAADSSRQQPMHAVDSIDQPNSIAHLSLLPLLSSILSLQQK